MDASCLNRLTDDQNQPRTADEAEAVERTLVGVQHVLKVETSNDPDSERRHGFEVLLSWATETIPLDSQITRRATELDVAGYGPFDALPLSS